MKRLVVCGSHGVGRNFAVRSTGHVGGIHSVNVGLFTCNHDMVMAPINIKSPVNHDSRYAPQVAIRDSMV